MDYRNRVHVDLTEDQRNKLQDLVPWGLRSQLLSVVIEDLLNLVETHGVQVIALLITKKVKPREVLSTLRGITQEEAKDGTG